MSNVAAHVIKKVGGAQLVATICGVDVSRVHRWTYPKERGGTGGAIPTWHQVALLAYAMEHGLDLTAADFFPQPERGRPGDPAVAALPPVPELREGKSPADALAEIDDILKRDAHLLPKPRKRA